LARFLDYVQGFERVWLTRRIDIARHWRATHPHVPFERPSAMTKERFVEAFGGVFEHSPWVAERAYEREMGPTHDSAMGVHALLCAEFRAATPEERLGVLKAHPDLAGKLAAAGELTPESTGEQASAGLDRLTPEERQTFQSLNAAYVERFAFPFIMAVKGRSKADILAAFRARLDNDEEAEFATACGEVEKIAGLRLKDLVG
ncbi:MAG: 2-oxo-4-hydroxy-4-carboxy-5-ureidoimidazoline decarboxylase, partial [Rhodobiaceae bacterium]|nr:2-oxo-4-hydroxy-4-carboxy-5-ureidoimidazoline decarboxylase [Rhodobiaceae bacterium]